MTEAEDQDTQPQSPVDTTELITEVTGKVKRVTSLREEIITLVAEIREGQRILGAADIMLSFPILDSVDAPAQKAQNVPVSGQQIASSITPMVPEIVDDSEDEGGEYTGGSGPSLDDGSAKQIVQDSAAPLNPQDESMFQESLAADMERAVESGYSKGKIFTQ